VGTAHYFIDSLRAQAYYYCIMNRLNIERRAQVVRSLVEGNSIRSTCRMTGVCKDAVLKLIRDMGAACASFHNRAVRNVPASRVQCDEIWSFCYAKEKNVPVEKEGTGAGSIWTWTAIDADSKLIISYLCGGRDASWACQFMEDLASRVTTRIQITTDGHRAYAEAVEGAFGMDVDYAMLIKLYGSPSDNPETRYSPATCIGIRTGILSGNPDRNHISTSYVERQNLNLRMGVRRFTRLTNAFSKKFENHCHMVAIYHAYYNFCRVHQTLRVTPAMEVGLADHVWSIQELITVAENRMAQIAAA
jgi:IS1 family transposase